MKKIKSDSDDTINDFAKNEYFSLTNFIHKIAEKYNKDNEYGYEVGQIFSTITDTPKAEQAFYKRYKSLGVKYEKDKYDLLNLRFYRI